MAANLIRRRVLAGLVVGILAACAAAPGTVHETGAPEPVAATRLFLVRHSEKDKGDDPGLTAEGAARAIALADRLDGESVTEIWSTRTRRTEQTAAPLAARLGLTVRAYDAGALEALSVDLLATPGVKLVVGHSNTTGALAAFTGADSGPAIDEATEFDRMYVISKDASGIVRSRIDRFGAPAVAGPESAE